MKRVIARDCLPSRSPLTFFAVVYLLADRYGNFPGWAWGVLGTLAGVIMLGWIFSRKSEVEIRPSGFQKEVEVKK